MRLSSLVLTLCGLFFIVALPACEDQHVGRMCFIQRSTGEGTNVVVNPQALECPSRLCLHYPKDPGATAEAALDLCTTECASDDECSGETTNAPGSCKTGFKCAWPVQVGPLCCKRMCVCRDLLNVPDGGTIATPSVCEPTAENRAYCPNL
ncbi:MAG TPA: hypothetical protein VGQ83_23915 [Polyangia bacterium]|jgi:hypothetical protein